VYVERVADSGTTSEEFGFSYHENTHSLTRWTLDGSLDLHPATVYECATCGAACDDDAPPCCMTAAERREWDNDDGTEPDVRITFASQVNA
jgi:hypothetical protein